MDFAEDTSTGQYLASTLLGTENQQYSMAVTTSGYQVGMYDQNCNDNMCKVPKKMPVGSGSSFFVKDTTRPDVSYSEPMLKDNG